MPEIASAAAWGAIAAGALLVGAAIAMLVRLPDRLLGLVLAFGAGVLMSTVAYELIEDALSAGLDSPLLALGFASGALVFFVGSVVLAGREGDDAGITGRGTGTGGLQIVLGAVLDGIPESVVLGASLVAGGGISVPVLVAVLISNVPEGIGASADLLGEGRSRWAVTRLWLIVVVASAIAAGLGYAVLRDAPAESVATAQTFAAGAIIAMLAESMIPEAYQQGGRAVGLATALGFALSALVSFSG